MFSGASVPSQLSCTVTVPVSPPRCVGANLMLSVQVAPAVIVLGQLFVSLNSPVIEIQVIASGIELRVFQGEICHC
jgi:hypothetical protein